MPEQLRRVIRQKYSLIRETERLLTIQDLMSGLTGSIKPLSRYAASLQVLCRLKPGQPGLLTGWVNKPLIGDRCNLTRGGMQVTPRSAIIRREVERRADQSDV